MKTQTKAEAAPSFESSLNLLDKAKSEVDAAILAKTYGDCPVLCDISQLDAYLRAGQIKLVVISAWLCHEIMAIRNKRNRAINPKNILRFRSLIHAGKFCYTGGSALFYPDGTVADFQHRCGACAIEGVPIAVVVVPNWKDTDMALVDDRSYLRQASGMLQLAGVTEPKVPADIVANLLRYRHNGSFKGPRPTNAAIQDEYIANVDLVTRATVFAKSVHAKYPDKNALGPSLVGSLYAVASVVNENLSRFGEFIDRLVSGEKLEGEEPKPSFMAGQTLEETKVSGKSKGLPDNVRAAIAITAYRAECAGKVVSKVSIPKKVESLPLFPSQELAVTATVAASKAAPVPAMAMA